MTTIEGKLPKFEPAAQSRVIELEITCFAHDTSGFVEFLGTIKDGMATPGMPKVTRPATGITPPPRVEEPLPRAPEVFELGPAEGIVLGDALDPPNGEFQIAGSPSRNEPTRNIPRDIVRVPSLDNTRFVETDLSRELKAEAEGAFDQELISATGLQPEVARPVPMEKPQGNIPRDIVRFPSLDNTRFVETDLSRELKAEAEGAFDQELISATGLQPEVARPTPMEKPQGIVLGDALDPPNGEFQIAGSPSRNEPTRNIPRDIVRVPSLDNTRFVETDLSRELKAEAEGAFDQELISATGLQPEVARPVPMEKPQGNIPRDIVRFPSLDNTRFVETDLSRELKAENAGGFDQELISLTGLQPEVARPTPMEKPQGIVLGDALDPPNGEFQIAGSPSRNEPTRNIPRDIVRFPSLDNIQFVETDLSRQLAADQKLESKTNDEAKTNLFNFKITTQ